MQNQSTWQTQHNPLLFASMKLAHPNISLQRVSQPSTYSIYRRLANLAIVLFVGVICINLWLLSNDLASNWYEKQANQLGRSLSLFSASVIGPLLAENDIESIEPVMAQLITDPHVSHAALYNYRGQILSSTSNEASIVASYRLKNLMPLVFVQDILHEGRLVGYLRLYLEEQQVMQYHDEYQARLFEQQLVLMLLAAAAGLILTRAFYKMRQRRFKQKIARENSDQSGS